MISPGASSSPSRFPALEPVPRLLRDLVHERTGVFFEDSRLGLMLEKLEVRAAARGCASFLDYYYILKYDENGPGEWLEVMDAFSVQETYFWREFDQVAALVSTFMPALAAKLARPIRIWSAACATGEEPFSIAMALMEGGWGAHPVEIVGSDASRNALHRAQLGLYRERSFRVLPDALRAKYFDAQPGGFALRPEVRAKVTFHWANLMDLDALKAVDSVDVIFCRNVFIYFSSATIKNTVAAFARRLPERNPLFVGSSESLLKLTEQFDLEQVNNAFAYLRNAR